MSSISISTLNRITERVTFADLHAAIQVATESPATEKAGVGCVDYLQIALAAEIADRRRAQRRRKCCTRDPKGVTECLGKAC